MKKVANFFLNGYTYFMIMVYITGSSVLTFIRSWVRIRNNLVLGIYL